MAQDPLHLEFIDDEPADFNPVKPVSPQDLYGEQDFMGPVDQPKLKDTFSAPQESTLGMIGRRLLHGPSDEEIGEHLARPGKGLLPILEHPENESWLGWGLRGLYNNLVQPLGSDMGMVGASGPKGTGVVDRLKAGSALEPIAADIAARPIPKPRVTLRDRGFSIQPEPVIGEPRLTDPTVSPVAQVPLNLEPIQTPQEKLLDSLKSVPSINEEQAKIYAQERGVKLGKVSDVITTGEAGAKERLGKLAGAHTKIVREPLKMEQADVDGLFDQITNHPSSIGFNKFHSYTGLWKVLEGKVPQTNELEALERVFGPEIRSIAGDPNHRPMSIISQTVNIPRKLMATMDMSAPLRQGIGLIHKGEFWDNIMPMFKAWTSEGKYKDIIKGIESKPTFKLQQDAGLALTDVASLSNREEQMVATYIDKLPGVKQSERAYSAFLNKLRSDTFDSLLRDAQAAGLDVNKDFDRVKELANFVNTATGRGSFGRFEHAANVANDVFFSPRLIASRMQMLNPQYYISASPQVRKEALKSLFAVASFGGTLGQLARLGGADVSADPRNTDFGKIKIGDTRIDPFGGFQQYITLASRLASGQATSSVSGNTYKLGGSPIAPTRLDTVGRFLESKTNPVINFVTGMLRGKDFRGEPFEVGPEILNRVTPMMIQDVYDLAKENPELIPIATPAAMFGMGVQTYR